MGGNIYQYFLVRLGGGVCESKKPINCETELWPRQLNWMRTNKKCMGQYVGIGVMG